jgi:pimeloyl-ACP methyl ester carboxylesterase
VQPSADRERRPRDAEGLDWLAGMGEENLEEFAAASAGAEELRTYLEQAREGIAGASAADLRAALGDLVSDVDRDALGGDFAEHVSRTMSAALADGIWGWFDDDLAHLRDWGFDLRDIARPVTVWQGRQDRFVPPAHGEWLAGHIPGARAELLGDHGHLSLTVAAYGDVLDGLLSA